MIFVDTGAWFALSVPWDANHSAAIAFARDNRLPLLTTDFILDEVLTLLVKRGQKHVALAVGERLMSESDAKLVRAETQDIDAAWDLFRRFVDKDWSFTDCVSYIIIQRLKLNTAFSFDQHFHQFGTVTVVPISDIKP